MLTFLGRLLRRLLGFRSSQMTIDTPAESFRRPDLIDLIGERYDCAPTAPARRTLIICAAPRTGSYELCRFLTAAGLGVPHEYFHDQFARLIAGRWSIPGDPLGDDMIGTYVDALRRRRATNDVFAIKLQFWQFDRFLRNRHGAALFKDAQVVHLYRADVAAQFTSWREAIVTGRWDFSSRKVGAPGRDGLGEALHALDLLIAEDAGFRRLFALLGINPMFFTFEDIKNEPRKVVNEIARSLGKPVNDLLLDEMLATRAPYPRGSGSSLTAFVEEFRTRAFEQL